MIEIGTLIKEIGWGYGIVTEIHEPNNWNKTQRYGVRWVNGGAGLLSAWQFEVMA